MRKAAIFNVVLWICAIFFSCSFDERDQQRNIQEQRAGLKGELNNLRYKVIKGKTEYLEDGYTKWGLAFEDSSYLSINSGVFANVNVGDTMCWEISEYGTWNIVQCTDSIIKNSLK